MTRFVQSACDTAPVPGALRRHWETAGVVAESARWCRLAGGRTNPIWRIDNTSATALVCKLFLPETATPLFANDPAAEVTALKALDLTGLAPQLIATARTALGDSVIYRHAPGAAWHGDPAPVARLLRRLHGQTPPSTLPQALADARGLRDQGREILRLIGAKDTLPPAPQITQPLNGQAFLHGDPIPGNIMQSAGKLTLIDWQCPAIGDPCLDLALFLSPAMQVVNGNPPLSPDQITRFLTAYGDTQIATRYATLAPLFHWRMATYCQWKVAHGDTTYASAVTLELAAMAAASEQG